MHGLYLLWWVQERRLPAAVVATILAAGDLALMLLEIPTGWVADRVGHRRSLIAGSAAQILGMVCCWLGRDVPGLLAASLLVALGDSLRSGADEALLYRTCLAVRREKDFQAIEARTRAAELGAMVALILAGGSIVATWGFAMGWIAEIALCSVGLAIACAMGEPPPCLRRASSTLSIDAGSASTSPIGRSPITRSSIAHVLPLMLPAALVHGAASATSFLVQTTGGALPARMSGIVAAITLAEAIGAAVAIRMTGGTVAQVTLGALAVAGVAAGLTVPGALLPAALGLAFLVGLAHPLRAVYIQREIADSVRATAASVAHACDMAVMLIALPAAGFSRRSRSTSG